MLGNNCIYRKKNSKPRKKKTAPRPWCH